MMKGWKTWVAVAGFILLAVWQIAQGNVEQGLAHLAVALGLLGLGHKIEKAK